MNINLAVYCVRSEDGSVNVEETKAKFLTDLANWETSQKSDLESVFNAINEFYDTMKGASVSMSVLYSAVSGKLNALTSSEAFNTVKKRCDAVIENNPHVFTSTRRTGTYRTADRKPKSENKAA